MSQASLAGSAHVAERPRLDFVVTAAVALAATIVAAAITTQSVDGEGAALAGLARASMVAVPVGVGLYAWHSRPENGFGRLLVAAGFGWFLTTFAESSDEVLYSTGRVAGWVVEAWLIWLILSFPSGRLSGHLDRALLGAAVAVLVVLYLPTALFADGFPTPSAFTSCDGGCPANAFQVTSQPPFIPEVVLPLREALTMLIYFAVTLRVGQKVLRATPLTRLTLLPVLIVAGGRAAVFVVALGVRRLSPESAVADALAWGLALAVPAIALAFLVGLLQRRLYAAGALEQLGLRTGDALEQGQLQAVLADAVGDPTLRIVYWREAPPSWIDERGRPWEPPGPDSGRCLTEIRENSRLVAGLDHDDALHDQVEFLQAVAAYVLTTLQNSRLTAQVEASLQEVLDSRTRILASGDRERRRIERDLHDGAQQRLVALGIQLELTEDLIRQDVEGGVQRLRELGVEVENTLEEIQALGRGVYPSLLAGRGLADALRAAALRLPVAATVSANGVGRYPADVENAVYFCCLEAMQNASKHAPGAHAVNVALDDHEGLVFEVSDDGAGFDPAAVTPGVGLTNMRDRLAAVGGALDVASSPGAGTVVTGKVPPAATPAFQERAPLA